VVAGKPIRRADITDGPARKHTAAQYQPREHAARSVLRMRHSYAEPEVVNDPWRPTAAAALRNQRIAIDFVLGNRRELDVGQLLLFKAFKQNVAVVAQPQVTGECGRCSVCRNLVVLEPLY
jgi:hypothetical protein